MEEWKVWEDLANAIILSAVEDYKDAIFSLARYPDSVAARWRVKREEKFFYSEWFECLTSLDPDYLLRRIREEIMAKEEEE